MKKSDTIDSLSSKLEQISLSNNIKREDLKSAAIEARTLENRLKEQLNEDITMNEENSSKTSQEGGPGTSTENRENLFDQLAKLQMEFMQSQIRERKKVKHINFKQNTFAGTGNDNIREWLFTINLNLDAAYVEDDDKTLIAAGYLRDNAMQVYRQATQNKKLDWEEFQKLMINKFTRKDSETDLVKKLMELTQTTTIKDYIERFIYILNQTNGIPENIKVYMFKTGIDKKVETEITYRNPKNIDEAIEIAQDVERT